MESKVYYEIKKESIEKNILDKDIKEQIFDKIKNFSEENILNAATHDKKNIGGKITPFGIMANHMYDFVKCEKYNGSIFFSLWNPHGDNELKYNKNNEYQGFDQINQRNKEGLFNGEIILNFDNFFLSFQRLVYQNKLELKNMNKKKKYEGFLDPYKKSLIMMLFGNDINYIIASILTKFDENKSRNINEIVSDIISEIKSEAKVEKEEIKEEEEEENIFHNDWLLTDWDDIKKDIINESKDIMNKKIKSNLYTSNKEEIIKILIQENKNKNKFIDIDYSKINILNIKEKMQEINYEIKSIATNITEEY